MKTKKYIDKQVLVSAQSNCFDVAGRLLCAAEYYQHLIKTGNKIPLQKKSFDYYNSFKFAHTNDPEELYSLLIEHMNIYAKMKERFQKQFHEQLNIPIKENELKQTFQIWKNGLQDNYLLHLYNAIENLLLEKDNEDYQKFVKDYYNEMEILDDQKDDFDPRNYMKYYPSIIHNNDEKEKNLKNKMKNNINFKLEMQLNKDYLDNPVNKKFENDLKYKPLDYFTPDKNLNIGNNNVGNSNCFGGTNPNSHSHGEQLKNNGMPNSTSYIGNSNNFETCQPSFGGKSNDFEIQNPSSFGSHSACNNEEGCKNIGDSKKIKKKK